MNRDRTPGRRLATLAICAGVSQALLNPAAAQSFCEQVSGTYEYAYPHNTRELNENHLILLECEGEQLQGWYYGTSDDFDSGREGYWPGFFVAEMEGIAISGALIRFTIQVADGEYFVRPVPLLYRNAQQVPDGLIEKWAQDFGVGRRQFGGEMSANQISLDVDGGKRIFKRLARE